MRLSEARLRSSSVRVDQMKNRNPSFGFGTCWIMEVTILDERWGSRYSKASSIGLELWRVDKIRLQVTVLRR
jgi:hypothetical protein